MMGKSIFAALRRGLFHWPNLHPSLQLWARTFLGGLRAADACAMQCLHHLARLCNSCKVWCRGAIGGCLRNAMSAQFSASVHEL